jgi:putative salt-induced outer membrane protein YdiY
MAPTHVKNWRSRLSSTTLRHLTAAAGALVLACALPGFCANPVAPPKPVIATNYVVVTNVVRVTVTNYIVTTNLVLSTNGLVARRTNSALPDLSWVPPEDDFDWIQLKSGEWLKGRIKAMQKRELEFDSEELELLTFDWKDIRQLRSPHVNDLWYGEHDEASGPVWITPNLVTVGGPGAITFPRSQLESITPGGSRANFWSGKISAGLTFASGNTKQVDYNAQATLQRRTPGTRFKLDYIGNFSRVNNVESANNQRVNTEFDIWLTRRLFVITPLAEYYSDRFQNVANRGTVGAGVGYEIFDQRHLEWSVSTGPAYQQTWFESVQPGDDSTRGSAAWVFGSQFDWEITRRIDLILEYRGQYTKRDVGETTHHGVAKLELELTKRLDLDISLIWDRTQNPKEESSGSVPQKDDFRLVLGLGMRF